MLTTALLLTQEPPRTITNPEDFSYYKKQLDICIAEAEQTRRQVEAIRALPFWERLLCGFELIAAVRRLARQRMRCLRLHEHLTAYNERSGLRRSLPDVPAEWRLQSFVL